mmetsp:Transcript_29267/g.84828  ORF Transcript_29267/g.84828 Transcript_29267/m.84828 type:complete len:216 (-) Transcript_29267:685-1332(-)
MHKGAEVVRGGRAGGRGHRRDDGRCLRRHHRRGVRRQHLQGLAGDHDRADHRVLVRHFRPGNLHDVRAAGEQLGEALAEPGPQGGDAHPGGDGMDDKDDHEARLRPEGAEAVPLGGLGDRHYHGADEVGRGRVHPLPPALHRGAGFHAGTLGRHARPDVLHAGDHRAHRGLDHAAPPQPVRLPLADSAPAVLHRAALRLARGGSRALHLVDGHGR